MQAYDVYKDMQARTGGDIYIGVVGAVRTGKSTFIRNFMEGLVLPYMEDPNEKQRVIDELPQSGSGRSVMTTQPKFVPGEAVRVSIDGHTNLSVRMVDCVGYLIPGALGQDEADTPRMVQTPWFDHEIPFEEAADIGTSKVIAEHATIGVVVTTDGSICEIDRAAYEAAEARAVAELKELGKPFVVVLNSAHPRSLEAQALQKELAARYGVSVVLLDALNLGPEEIRLLMSEILYEFPVRRIHYTVPGWVCALEPEHPLFAELLEKIQAAAGEVTAMKEFARLVQPFEGADYVRRIAIDEILPGEGSIHVDLDIHRELFYEILGQQCGCEVRDDSHLMELIGTLVHAKQAYDKLAAALEEMQRTGYGMVCPSMEEMQLAEPELVKQGGRYGVRLKASAPGLHLIKVDVETQVEPLVGTEAQSKEFVEYLAGEYALGPDRLWNTDIFGKSIYNIVQEGLYGKMAGIPGEAREKLRTAMGRMVNEGDAGTLCILL